MSTKLYHFPPSLCSQKVRLALAEKGVNYTSQLVNIGPVMENYQPWYARINPEMVVPTLDVNGDIITNSARIVVEIDKRFDGPELGSGSKDVAYLIGLQDGLKIREIGYSKTSGIMGHLTSGVFEQRKKVLTKMRDENPDLSHLYQTRLDDVRDWKAHSHSAEQIAGDVETIKSTCKELDILLEETPYLAGYEYSLADVVWTVVIARLTFMGYTKNWPETHPSLADYYARMKARPSFAEADVWERFKLIPMLPMIGQVIMFKLGLRK